MQGFLYIARPISVQRTVYVVFNRTPTIYCAVFFNKQLTIQSIWEEEQFKRGFSVVLLSRKGPQPLNYVVCLPEFCEKLSSSLPIRCAHYLIPIQINVGRHYRYFIDWHLGFLTKALLSFSLSTYHSRVTLH